MARKQVGLSPSNTLDVATKAYVDAELASVGGGFDPETAFELYEDFCFNDPGKLDYGPLKIVTSTNSSINNYATTSKLYALTNYAGLIQAYATNTGNTNCSIYLQSDWSLLFLKVGTKLKVRQAFGPGVVNMTNGTPTAQAQKIGLISGGGFGQSGGGVSFLGDDGVWRGQHHRTAGSALVVSTVASTPIVADELYTFEFEILTTTTIRFRIWDSAKTIKLDETITIGEGDLHTGSPVGFMSNFTAASTAQNQHITSIDYVYVYNPMVR